MRLELREQQSWSLRALRLAMRMAAALAVLCAALPVFAQRYKTIPPNAAARTVVNLNQVLRDPTAFQAAKGDVDKYFKQYFFATMTSATPDNLGLLGKQRDALFRYIRRTPVKAAQEHLTQLTLEVMHVVSRDNYHPSVRYNAVLIIGMLDQRVAGARGVPPVPLPAAAGDLLELLEQEEFQGVKVLPALKVGALIGLERHARFGIDGQYAVRATAAALAIVNEKEAPEDMAADVHHWMKVAAARVLANQYAKGPTAEVQAGLTAMIQDGEMNLADRCAIAKLMGKIDYTSAAAIDSAAAANALAGLAKEVVVEEAGEARDFQKKILEGNQGIRPGRFSRSRGGPEGPTYGRRRLLDRLISIEEGAKSLSKGLADEAKQKLDRLVALLNPVIVVAADKDSLDLDITPKVIELDAAIAGLVVVTSGEAAGLAAAGQ